jgi:hypothetical protein
VSALTLFPRGSGKDGSGLPAGIIGFDDIEELRSDRAEAAVGELITERAGKSLILTSIRAPG